MPGFLPFSPRGKDSYLRGEVVDVKECDRRGKCSHLVRT